MKKAALICALLVILLMPSIGLVTHAHPGRTDSKGGHTNRSTGEYHYHHGQSAHDHYDMDGDGDIDCPYDFDNKTEKKSSSDVSPKENHKANNKTIKWSSVLSSISEFVFIAFLFILTFIIICC